MYNSNHTSSQLFRLKEGWRVQLLKCWDKYNKDEDIFMKGSMKETLSQKFTLKSKTDFFL